MKIACLGWGPLVWDPRDLPIEAWRRDGPPMRLEFARSSGEGWISLVLVPRAGRAQCLWARMRVASLAEARLSLAHREGIAPDAIERDIGYWTRDNESNETSRSNQSNQSDDSESSLAKGVGDWAGPKELDAVVWNAQVPRQLLTPENAVTTLRSLKGEVRRRAEETIRQTHRQIDTPVRRRVERELSWTPIGFL